MIYDIESVDCKFVETYFISFPMTYKLWNMKCDKVGKVPAFNEKERRIMYNSFLKYLGGSGSYYHGQDWTYLF